MWNGHLDRITIAKHRIELLQWDPAPVHSAPHQASSKPPEFEKAGIDKMVAENIIEPAHTE